MYAGEFYDAETGLQFDVYKLQVKRYTRLDIVERGGKFHLEPERLVYGEFNRGNTNYVYGDRDVGRRYNETLARSMGLNVKPQVHPPEWRRDGSDISYMYTKIVKRLNETDYYIQEDKNHIPDSYMYGFQGSKVFIVKISEDSMVIEPLHAKQYEKVGKDLGEVKPSATYLPYEVLTAKYDLSWQSDYNFDVLEEVEAVREYFASFPEGDPTGFDYETNTLEFYAGNEDADIAGIVLARDKWTSMYLPFGMESDIKNLPREFLKEVYDFVRTRELVSYNKKFETRVNYSLNWQDLEIAHDPIVLSHLLNPNVKNTSHELGDVMEQIDGNVRLKLSTVFNGRKNVYFPSLPKDVVRIYACPDGTDALRALEELSKKLPSDQWGLYGLESRLASEVKAQQELWGLRVDTQQLAKEADLTKELVDRLQAMVNELTQSNINLNSGPQVAALLFERLGAPILKRTEKGLPATGADVLAVLAKTKAEEPRELLKDDIRDLAGNRILNKEDVNNSKYPEALLILTYKTYAKLRSAYDERFSRQLNSKYSNGRIFFWVNQFGAESGRQSSPIHQLPKSRKAHIMADSEDHCLAISDYKTVELRVAFSLSGEREMVELCKDKNLDIHRAVAKLITGKEPWEVSADERSIGKRRNFGVIYDISASGLAVQLNGVNASAENVAQAEKAIVEFYAAFPRYAEYMKYNKRRIMETGQISTKWNRRRYFPEARDPNISRSYLNSLLRQGNNMPVQGTAADILKMSEVYLEEEFRKRGWNRLEMTPQGPRPLARVALSAHDETFISFNKKYVPPIELLQVIKDCMELEIDGFAPLFVDTAIVDTWGEAKTSEAYTIPGELRDNLLEELDSGKWKGVCFDDPKSTFRAMIKEHLERELVSYMEDLCKKAGNRDAATVSKLVKHDQLTHDLIARFPQSSEHKSQYGKLNHYEQIQYSTEQYLLYSEGNTELIERYVSAAHQDEPEFDLEQMVDFERANPDEDDGLEEAEEGSRSANLYEDSHYGFDKYETFTTRANKKYERIWSFGDAYYIDAEGLPVSKLKDLRGLIAEQETPGGSYKIYVKFGGQAVDSKLRTAALATDKILEYLEKEKL